MRDINGFSQILRLFGRRSDDVRWLGLAESMETLALATYLVDRNNWRAVAAA